MTPQTIINSARETLGTPFRHQGRIVGRGIDCVGVAIHVAKSHGIPYVDHEGYSRTASGGILESAIDEQPGLIRVQAASAMPGDILVMRFSGDPQHVAIHAGDTIIHAFEKSGKVVEHDLTRYWQARVVRVYRFREINQ